MNSLKSIENSTSYKNLLNDNIYTIPSGSRYTKSMASFSESIKESFENLEEVLNAFEKASGCYTEFVRDDNLIPDWVKKEKCVQTWPPA